MVVGAGLARRFPFLSCNDTDRYVDWAVTTPLMILNLGLLAGEDTVMIAAVMGADVGMIVAGYLGAVALVPTVKWLWFIIGLAVFAPVVIALVRTFRQTVIDKNDVDRIELYGKVSLLTIVVWSLYPIVWFLGVGTGAIGVSLEAISFAILDVISKCVFSFMIVQLNVSPKPPIPSSAPQYLPCCKCTRTGLLDVLLLQNQPLLPPLPL